MPKGTRALDERAEREAQLLGVQPSVGRVLDIARHQRDDSVVGSRNRGIMESWNCGSERVALLGFLIVSIPYMAWHIG